MRREFGLVLLVILLAGCGGDGDHTEADERAAPSSPQAVHLVIDTDGSLRVSRLSWDDVFARASFGTLLRDGDLLQLPDGSRATVICADLRVSAVRSGVGGIPCDVVRDAVALRATSDSPSTTLRSTLPDFPRLLSPRDSKVYTEQPAIRWRAAIGAPDDTTYLVSLKRDGETLWSQEVSGATAVIYPGSPPLEAGATYLAEVRQGAAGQGPSSSQEVDALLTFSVVTADEADRIADLEQSISGLDLPEDRKRFLRAKLYRSYGLRAEAIELLTDLTGSLPLTNVFLELGDLYIDSSLPDQAEEPYRQALQQAVEQDDIEGQARAHYGLGVVFRARGNASAAREELALARDVYQQLGDASRVSEIEAELAEIGA